MPCQGWHLQEHPSHLTRQRTPSKLLGKQTCRAPKGSSCHRASWGARTDKAKGLPQPDPALCAAAETGTGVNEGRKGLAMVPEPQPWVIWNRLPDP